MPKLVQVTDKQVQISEEDTTKARYSDSGDHDPKEVVPKACDPDSCHCDPEEIVTKSQNLNFIYYRRSKHEGARVLAAVRRSRNREENCWNRNAPFSFSAGLRSSDHLFHL
ncbi:hypothetical protein TIFTF001_013993 [Ficus carica]|uniref:Uncharacterized protein n=1 Tax=Ficus carica TaxID=3494 RepID=A0AA88D6K4_FICCA|nr:hypothetical protein TIFTF001_013993 [Ficus carica]